MRRRSAGAWWAVTAAYGLALATASVLPSGEDAPGGWDKAISPSLQNALHVPAYAGLAWLACAAWSRSGGMHLRQVLAVFVAAVVFGVALEFAQAGIPGRTASAWDAVLNVAGAAVGLAAWRWLGPAPRNGGPAGRVARGEAARELDGT